jgi:hypothetical protein
MRVPMNIAAQLAEGVWYAEGAAFDVAAAVLRKPDLFDELFECLLSEDRGTSKRAALALEAVSDKRPELFELYADIVLTELENHAWWHIRFRLCSIVPRIKLSRREFNRAVTLFQSLADHPQNALAVNAIGALSELVARTDNDELREETLWLVEHKSRTGTKAMQARCRQMLPLLRKAAHSSDK